MATTAEINAFIKRLGALAVAESNRRIANGGGFVLPSVCIAQSALETGWGSSGLMTRANAFFGIKAGGSWTGKVYTAGTWEVANGAAYNTTANFRAYDTLEDSVRDYYDLITNARYKNALSYGTDRSAWKTPRECITAIWAGGYATDTLYVEKIMSTINARSLTAWDKKVDGVGVGVTDEPNIEPDYIFTSKDFKQGMLILTDSGRTVGHDESVLTAVALDWSKAFTVKKNTTYIIAGLTSDTVLNVAKINGENANVFTSQLANGATITALAGEKVGFYITYTQPKLSQSLTPADIGTITLSNVNNLGYGDNYDEKYNTSIAHFVKIG